MTMVNPNFETILVTNSNPRKSGISDDSSALEKETLSLSGDATPVSTDSLTPQPFEVVLVTDDVSENSNGEISPTKNQSAVTDKISAENNVTAVNQRQKQQSMESTDSPLAKPFLRVRSIAELQKIKIHLCSVCGLSFDSLSAFERHSQLHEGANEVGRATPVQMISPIVSQPNKEALSEPHHTILAQMRQKLAILTANGQLSPNNSGIESF